MRGDILDVVAPGGREALEDEVEVPSRRSGKLSPAEEGVMDCTKAEPSAGHGGGHVIEDFFFVVGGVGTNYSTVGTKLKQASKGNRRTKQDQDKTRQSQNSGNDRRIKSQVRVTSYAT